jgi:hypothetical protein
MQMSDSWEARAAVLVAVTSPSPDEPVEALSIGVVFGGTPAVDEAWRPETQRLMKAVIAARDGVVSPLAVNVVFHVDGHLLPPVDFEGVRTGSFSRKLNLLMVQAAVPTDSLEDRRAVLLALLRKAVDEAEAFAKRRKIADALPEVRGVVESLPLA